MIHLKHSNSVKKLVLTIAGGCVITVVWLFSILERAGGEYGGGGLITGAFAAFDVCPWRCVVLGPRGLYASTIIW